MGGLGKDGVAYFNMEKNGGQGKYLATDFTVGHRLRRSGEWIVVGCEKERINKKKNI